LRKKTVSEAEDEPIVRIPLVVRFRPIIVQPRTIVVAIHVEDARVAIGVGLCGAPSLSLPV